MSQAKHNLLNIRAKLSDEMTIVSELLETLEHEGKNLPEQDKKLFYQRLNDINQMMVRMVDYDTIVQLYIRRHPESHNVQYIQDKLERAKLYIKRMGGDWSVVEWGKKSDYF